MTITVYSAVVRFVTVIRSYRAGTQSRPLRQLNARQAMPLSLPKRLLDRGATPAPFDALMAPAA